MAQQTGTLFVVGTPIGNLADLSPRVRETLQNVRHICAEDTRRTRALLNHLGIHGPSVQKLDAHAGNRAIDKVIAGLKAGEDTAVVSDAGTPSVSDPGGPLASACHRAGIPVRTVPGPSAVTAAVSVSGFVQGSFLFVGFLPRSGKKRARALLEVAQSERPVVLFEAANRTQKTLTDLAALVADRKVCIARELTKLHEEVQLGGARELSTRQDWRGEVALVIEGAESRTTPMGAPPERDVLRAALAAALEAGAGKSALAAALAERFDRPKRELYQLVLDIDEER